MFTFDRYSISPIKREVLKSSDTVNRTESLKTSAVSFAYQSDRENQIGDYEDENQQLRKIIYEELEKSKQDDSYSKQIKNNDDWQRKYNMMIGKKDLEIQNLNKLLRQMEIEVLSNINQNKLLTKERAEINEQNKKSIDTQQIKKLGELEYKINLLLNENHKLNQYLQERIGQIERMKLSIDQKDNDHEKEKQAIIERYEQIIQDKINLFAKEKQQIEKFHNQSIQNNKNDFLKQIQFLNSQNSQLSTLLNSQKEKLEILETQLDEQLNCNDLLLTERETKEQLMKLNSELEGSIQLKDKEYQDILLKYNESEKKLQNQIKITQDNEAQYLKQIEELNQIIQETKKQTTQIQQLQNQIQTYEQEKQYLVSQLNENQNFIEELQSHLSDIHTQITKFKEEKQQLKRQNADLQEKLHTFQNDYSLPSFAEQSSDNSAKKKNSSCLNTLKQYSLANKSYQAQFQKKLRRQKDTDIDSFGQRQQVSCLEMIKKDFKMDSSDEENPIQQFKLWKQMTDRD